MAFWHPAWTSLSPYAARWLKVHPTLKATSAEEIGAAMGREAYQRWCERSPPTEGLEDFGGPDPFLLGHFGFPHGQFLAALNAWKLAFKVPRITVDSNIIIGMDRPKQAPIYALLRQLHQDRVISVAVSARFVQDKWADHDEGRVWRHHQAFRFFDLLPSSARAGESLPGFDVPTDSDLMGKIECILRVHPQAKNPNQRRDADHVYSHLISNRDGFLTHELRLLQWRSHLLSELGVVAMTPEAFLTTFNNPRASLPAETNVDTADR